MKSLNYSNITVVIRRIHQASIKSEKTGMPVDKVLAQDRELRQKINKQKLEDRQRRDFMKTMKRMRSIFWKASVTAARTGCTNYC